MAVYTFDARLTLKEEEEEADEAEADEEEDLPANFERCKQCRRLSPDSVMKKVNFTT